MHVPHHDSSPTARIPTPPTLGLFALLVFCWMSPSTHAAPYEDRFVWIFGWNLGRDSDVEEITRIFETASQHGLNGAVVSFGLDTLCKRSPDYFRRLEEIRAAAERNRLELIPAIFSVGYGGSVLSHDRQLAEGLPVVDALFQVKGWLQLANQTCNVRGLMYTPWQKKYALLPDFADLLQAKP